MSLPFLVCFAWYIGPKSSDELADFCRLVALTLHGVSLFDVACSEIENPFGHDFNDLPIDSICQTIEGNLFELLQVRTIHCVGTVPVLSPGIV